MQGPVTAHAETGPSSYAEGARARPACDPPRRCQSRSTTASAIALCPTAVGCMGCEPVSTPVKSV